MYYRIVTASGGFRGHLYGGNNELVWWTEVYATRAGARNAISIAKASATAPVYED